MRINQSSWHGLKSTLLQVIAISTIGAWQVKGQVSFSAGIEVHSPNDFYSPLSASGQWMELPPYGRCWRPVQVESGWRPYTNGHWEWTDCGWYWVSDEPWAWACYHYGSWTYDPSFGWVWIPGTEWAPAWVVWREAPDYIGWAPCGPGGALLPAASFVFIDAPHFHDPIHRDKLIVNNTTIINRTRVINNITHETRTFDGNRQRVVVNRGPGVDPIQRVTGTKFTARPVREVALQTPVPQTVPQGRQPGQVRTEPARSSQQAPVTPTGREQNRIYREPTPPEPAGKEQPRIYREPPPAAPQPPPQSAPRSAPEPQPRQVPQQVRPAPRANPNNPPERVTPPPGARESGQGQVDRGRQEAGPRTEPPVTRPAPTPPPQPQKPPPNQEGQNKKDGERG